MKQFKYLLIILAVYFLAPKGYEVSNGAFILLYKASLSILCAGLILKYCDTGIYSKAIVFIELLASISQIPILFTKIAHELHNSLFAIISWTYDNYEQIPFWLFLAELIVVGLSFVRLGGYKKWVDSTLNSIRDRFSDYRRLQWR